MLYKAEIVSFNTISCYIITPVVSPSICNLLNASCEVSRSVRLLLRIHFPRFTPEQSSSPSAGLSFCVCTSWNKISGPGGHAAWQLTQSIKLLQAVEVRAAFGCNIYKIKELKSCGLLEQWEIAAETINCRAGSPHKGLIRVS